MKKLLLLTIALIAMMVAVWILLAPGNSGENPGNMHVYLVETDEMVRQGDYSAALERYIWFHHHVLEHDPHMTGVRLSFALGGWQRLAEVYPPALETMIETRDQASARLRAGKGNRELFNEVDSFNARLGDDAVTVELFKHLHEAQPRLAERVWSVARSKVIAAGEYELANQYIGNPMHALAQYRRSYQRSLSWSDDDEEFEEYNRQYTENRFVERTLDLMRVYTALGRDDLVEQIGSEALETFRDPRIEFALEP